MESFPGIFVASTNLMDGLDQASLRRFDLKVKSDFLRTEQAWALLQRHCEVQGLEAPTASQAPALAALTKLTPGDFAAVARQHRFRERRSVADWVGALAGECGIKGGAKAAIGFC